MYFPHAAVANPGQTLRVSDCTFDEVDQVGCDILGEVTQVHVTNNTFVECNGGGVVIQCRLGSASFQPEVIVMGNSFSDPLALLNVFNPSLQRGVETDWAGSIVNGNQMVFNRATIQHP